MSAALHHAVNGWFSSLRGESATARSSRDVVRPTPGLGLPRSLHTAVTSPTSAAVRALQKKLRDGGFKNATVEPILKGDGGGFLVQYEGQEYTFWIDEAKMRNNGSLFDELEAAGCQLDNHESDLYVRDTPEARAILNQHGQKFTTFTSDADGQRWLDVPFMYAPFWRKKGMTGNGRGLYHGTGIGRNDMVLHQDHRGRWRIDLITSAGGNHTDVTGRESGAGPNQGYSTAELAFAGALDEQRRRGLRGKTHVWVQQGDEYASYEPEGDHLPNGRVYHVVVINERTGSRTRMTSSPVTHSEGVTILGKLTPHRDTRALLEEAQAHGHETNGRRTGILSDGTRVNVYHDPVGGGDAYTIVPHSMAWDGMERGGMREMLGTDASGRGFSQWTTGQEGRHLGRKLAWDEVPEELKRHVERRIVGESMVANPRRAARKQKPKIETREARIQRQWDEAEEAGLVKLDADAEQENYFDVYGEPDDPEERDELIRQIDRQGVWHVASYYLDQETGDWVQADGVGMIFGDDAADPTNPYILDMKQVALENIYGGHTKNARGSTVDEHAQRELTLYIENEYALIGADNSIGKAIDKNMRRKVASGKYDPALAPKGWQHLIDEGAKRYAKAYSTGNDHAQIFSAATRRAVATDFARAWEAENLKR